MNNNTDFTIVLTVGYSTIDNKVYPDIDVGQYVFNNLFWNSPPYIIKRECPYCTTTHQIIYYRRITDVTSFDAYSNMKNVFTNINNLINEDFALYSTLNDALNQVHPWNYCNYNDGRGVGGFRDCGPNGVAACNFASNNVYWVSCAKNARFSIYTPGILNVLHISLFLFVFICFD